MINSWNPAIIGEQLANGGSGGGGTSVEANPTGAATDSLEKIMVGDTIYSVGSTFKTKVITNAGGSHTVTIDPELPEGSTIISITGMATRADTSVRYSLPIIAPQADYSSAMYISEGNIVISNVGNHFNISDITLVVTYI